MIENYLNEIKLKKYQKELYIFKDKSIFRLTS